MKKIIYFLLILVLIIVSCSRKEGDLSETFSDGIPGESSDNGNGQIEPGQITAGEWNDLLNWDFWNNLFQNQEYSLIPQYWSFDLNNRVSVNLKNKNSLVLPNIKVKLLNSQNEVLWESITDNFGNAELWPNLKKKDSELKIQIGNKIYNEIVYFKDGVNNIVYDTSAVVAKKLDLAFVVDATGSMGDELEYLKVELVDIINRVKSDNPNIVINLGSVFYRDEQDDYVTKKSGFSQDIDETIDFIKEQSADGGGDYPEAVHTALDVSINDLQWLTTSTTKIIFLILDAPPHYDTQILSDIHNLIYTASKKGIKIIPVTASGIDKKTEFLMRYFAIATNGTYVFITNDSGIGNEHIEPTVGEYEVEYLNDLIVRLINKYVEF